jgi:hypothetical protein
MYNFTTLSPRDFELLVRDLLQKHLGIFLESFKSGRDKGIDLRFATARDGALIAQCKHYAESGIKGLTRVLKEERSKLVKLSPRRYILATSVPLTSGQKDSLAADLHPYCQSSADVLGCDELNNILTQNPDVERAHFKLWLTSTTVLARIVNSRLYEQSRVTVEDIQSKMRLYVQNDSYHEARAVLSSDHYCIISGVPGTGKTFLAEILLVDYINQGYEPYVITSNISEGYAALRAEARQVFYYDDFLGQTGLDDKLDKNEDASLLRFIGYVKNRKGVKFILTTREYILQKAKQFYERLDSSDFDHAKCIIDLSKYTRVNRAQILYNHLYFAEMPEAFCAEVCRRKALLRIVDHPNYSPRIIQWMCDMGRHRDCAPQDYATRFISVLDHPVQLWKHAYEKHISPAARCALLVLAAARSAMRLEDLQEAFLSLAEVHSRRYGAVFTPDSCLNVLKELEGSFVRIERKDAMAIVGFHNPSVLDFLESHLAGNEQVLRDLCDGIVFYEC